MQVLHPCCAGLDVHKKSVTGCVIHTLDDGTDRRDIRTFGTATCDLLRLCDWLTQAGCTCVAMESTGVYWKPVYNILEGSFELLLANARHIKNVPGRKTDVKDAEWVAELLRHGLLRPSFVPARPQRELRELTRQRSKLVADRAHVVSRLHKVLEDANIKLASVATDVTGVSARDMLAALIDGKADPQSMAALARGRMRGKREALAQALTGYVRDHHRFLLIHQLEQIDFLEEQIQAYSQEIVRHMREMDAADQAAAASALEASGLLSMPDLLPVATDTMPPPTWAEAVTLVDTVLGLDQRAAECVLAEIGTDMSRFATHKHIASWGGQAPGNNVSAGKRRSGKTTPGNKPLGAILNQAAWATVRSPDSYFAAVYHRLAPRLGKKRAIVAVSHRILIAIYYVLKNRQPFQDKGARYFDERAREQVVTRLVTRLYKMGYAAHLEPVQTVTTAAA